MRRTFSVLVLPLLLAACTGDVAGRPDRGDPPTAEELAAHTFCQDGETMVDASFSPEADIVLESCAPENGEAEAILRLRERVSRTVLDQTVLNEANPDAAIHWYLDGYVTYMDGDREIRFNFPVR